ncbi:MAG TPA: TetR/AcrR family transcriptional regulator [Acetobacteraceae bacterium]|nr:TetR/AcrR family transcriptional regulator [Acetobacteraceae bacterium]
MTSKNDSGSSAPILGAAQQLFLASGYDGLDLDLVGKAAGVSRQTVYNQFGSKEAIFRAMVQRHWDTIHFEAASSFAIQTEMATDPAHVLRHFATTLLRFVTETDQVAFTRLVIAESRRLPWIAAEFYRAGKEPILKAFAGALALMTEKGLIRCTYPELAADQFMGLLQEFITWPRVMAIDEAAAADLPPTNSIIEEAISMFLARYARPATR